MKHLIIGNGIAGISGARAIREMDSRAEIVMVSDETGIPYSRPMISHVLDGSQPPEKLPLFSGDIYKHLNISPVFGERVSVLHTAARTVGLVSGREIGFDRLLIASGADARRIDVPGADLDNIFYMRTVKDVLAQTAAISKGVGRALVLGGGLVGFKAAHGLLKRGIPVTMLITSGYPLAMQVDKTAGRMIQDELVSRGLTVRVGVSVTAFEGAARVERALLDTGDALDCDLVIAGKGVIPSLDFVPKEEIKTATGILVDAHLQSSVPGIYAAGDTVEALDIARQTRWVNAIWPEAEAQGRIAGLNMAGRPVEYPGSLSRNVMRVYGLDVMTLGLANPEPDSGLEVIQAGGPEQTFYRSLVFRGDILAGAVLVNQIEQGGVLRALIESQMPVSCPKHNLLSAQFNISRLM